MPIMHGQLRSLVQKIIDDEAICQDVDGASNFLTEERLDLRSARAAAKRDSSKSTFKRHYRTLIEEA